MKCLSDLADFKDTLFRKEIEWKTKAHQSHQGGNGLKHERVSFWVQATYRAFSWKNSQTTVSQTCQILPVNIQKLKKKEDERAEKHTEGLFIVSKTCSKKVKMFDFYFMSKRQK